MSKHLPGGTSLPQTSIIIQATPTTHNLWCSWWIQDAWSHSLLGHSVKTQLQNWRNPTAGGPNPYLARWGRAVLNFKPKVNRVQCDRNERSKLEGQEVLLTEGKQMSGNRTPTKCWLKLQLFNLKAAVWSALNSLFNCFLSLQSLRKKNS